MTKFAIAQKMPKEDIVCDKTYKLSSKNWICDTEKETEELLKNVFKNNSESTLKEMCEELDFKVVPINCFENGQYKEIYFK